MGEKRGGGGQDDGMEAHSKHFLTYAFQSGKEPVIIRLKMKSNNLEKDHAFSTSSISNRTLGGTLGIIVTIANRIGKGDAGRSRTSVAGWD